MARPLEGFALSPTTSRVIGIGGFYEGVLGCEQQISCLLPLSHDRLKGLRDLHPAINKLEPTPNILRTLSPIIITFERFFKYMTVDNYSSKIFQSAVDEFSKLPGIGKKTALRLVLNLLRQDNKEVEQFSNTLVQLINEIQYCQTCNNISESDTCEICASPHRDQSLICVVQDIRDVIAVENTRQYKGLYHVLGGIISPVDGIGPNDLNIESLVDRVVQNDVKEIILALSSSMEGETTNFYIFRRLEEKNVQISSLARGIAIGDELEYADEISLGRSIIQRTPYRTHDSNP